MPDEIRMPERIARMIIEMESICYSEGIGPENQELIGWIAKNYPGLKDEFSYLKWPPE